MANHDRITRKIDLAGKKLTLKMVDGAVVDVDKGVFLFIGAFFVKMNFPLGIRAMKDSTELFKEGKFEELHAVLQEDGYVLVRQVLPLAHVQHVNFSNLFSLSTSLFSLLLSPFLSGRRVL